MLPGDTISFICGAHSMKVNPCTTRLLISYRGGDGSIFEINRRSVESMKAHTHWEGKCWLVKKEPSVNDAHAPVASTSAKKSTPKSVDVGPPQSSNDAHGKAKHISRSAGKKARGSYPEDAHLSNIR